MYSMSNVPWKDLKYSRFYMRSVYCSSKFVSDLNQNGCEIVRATAIPEFTFKLIANTRVPRLVASDVFKTSITTRWTDIMMTGRLGFWGV